MSQDVLGASPHAGCPARVPGTREFVITRTPYILAYAVTGERIDVLAVLHGAGAWPERFEP